MSAENFAKIRSKPSSNKLEQATIENKIKCLQEIEPGDHIVIVENPQKYVHAILASVERGECDQIEVIYFDDGAESESLLAEFTLNEDTKNPKKQGIKKCRLSVDLNRIEIYRINYDGESTLSLQATIEKASKYIGEIKYNLFANNDEHFAIYSKTGKAAKLFIVDPKDLSTRNIIGKSIPEKIVANLAQESGQIILVNTAKHVATKFPRSAVSTVLPVAAEAAGAFIGVGVEGLSMSYDIYKKHKDLKDGKLSDIKFKKYIATRVTRGTMSVAGGIGGGIIGQIVIPVPVVGAFIGSVVGGIVGAAVGHGQGILIGELVEVIDNKVNERNAPKSNLLVDVDSNENTRDSISSKSDLSSKFSVLDKLVFKYDKNILKPENYAHLKQEKIIEISNLNEVEENSILSTSESTKVFKHADEFINVDDYEIYRLNETNEILTDLNLLSNALEDENNRQTRISILEQLSADQLPSDLSVYFSIRDEKIDFK